MSVTRAQENRAPHFGTGVQILRVDDPYRDFPPDFYPVPIIETANQFPTVLLSSQGHFVVGRTGVVAEGSRSVFSNLYVWEFNKGNVHIIL